MIVHRRFDFEHLYYRFYIFTMNVKSIIFQVADSLIRVSRQLGITTTAVITEMDNPLGQAVGNSLEVSL